MDRRILPPVVVMAPLAAATVGYLFLPDGVPRELGYCLIGLVCVVVAFGGLLHRSPPRPAGWLLVLTGFLGWALADLTFFVEQRGIELAAYPAPSDAVYAGSYLLLGSGLVIMVRRRGTRADLPAVLDAAILATGTAVVVGVFVIAPIAGDSSLSTFGKLTSSFYPVADVMLLGILARLWTTPSARTAAFRLLAASLTVTLSGDVFYNVTAIVSGDLGSWRANDVFWLASYVLIAGAAWSPSVHELAEPSAGREDLADPYKRFVVLTGGLLLPAVTLIVDGLTGTSLVWPVVAGGSVVLCVLVLSRMAGLLATVRSQAVQLAALAKSDPLTGVANRRSLDHELSRACQAARVDGTPLSVALLDLDNFKAYNDSFGHPAGDLLLREACVQWMQALEPGEFLARYGGEEFVVLFRGRTASEARDRMLALSPRTPGGQTFSAGVATWDVTTEPMAVLAAADVALYNAKRAGRNRVRLFVEDARVRVTSPQIVFQPIVDLTSRVPVAMEALSQFPAADTTSVFDAARRLGAGPDLEAAAISAARARRREGMMLGVNVSLDTLTTPPVRDALAGDLTGIILEISEDHDLGPSVRARTVVQDCRDRGAIIAVDHWGRGFSNMERLLMLRPEIVKVDLSLVQDLDVDHHRAAIQTITTWAELVGARVCAVGIETEEQWHRLLWLGVHLGQGWFFGRPAETHETGQSLDDEGGSPGAFTGASAVSQTG